MLRIAVVAAALASAFAAPSFYFTPAAGLGKAAPASLSEHDHRAHAIWGNASSARSNNARRLIEAGGERFAPQTPLTARPVAHNDGGLARVLLARDRVRKSVVATYEGKPRHLATMDTLMRVVTPEGFTAVLDCPDGAAMSAIRFAAYGLPYLDNNKALQVGRVLSRTVTSSCKCFRTSSSSTVIPCTSAKRVTRCVNTTVDEEWDAYYPLSFDVVSAMCIGRERCDVDAETELFSGGVVLPWDKDGVNPFSPFLPAPEKRLAIEAQCKPVCSPTAPSAGPNAIVRTFVNNVYNRSAGSTATYQCKPGHFYTGGANVTQCVFPTSDFPPATIQCGKCMRGFYCPGDGARYPCPNGTFSNSDTDTTPMCSGFCELGFLCNQPGADNAFANPCGGTGNFVCPRRDAEYAWNCNSNYCNSIRRAASVTVRIKVPDTAYSLPENVPVDRRFYWLPCPVNRQCVGGIVLPHFKWAPNTVCSSGDLISGVTNTFVEENRTGFQTGVRVRIDTPGFPDSDIVKWSVMDNVWDPASRWFSRDFASRYRSQRRWQRCPTSNLEMFSTGRGGRDAVLRVKPDTASSPMLWDTCGRRFPVVIRGERPDNSKVAVECLVNVDIRRLLLPPIITNCEGLSNVRRVEEMRAPGTAVGAPMFATQAGGVVQKGVVMRWLLPDTKDAMDFAVDMCSGQIFTADVLNKTTAADIGDIRFVRVQAIADGASLGMGSASVFCTASINVTRLNRLPTVFTASLTIPELRPAGTLVGTVEFGDPDFDDVGKVRIAWGPADSRDPGAFAINSTTGAVTTTYVLNALNSGIYAYYVTANVTDGKSWAAFPVTIKVTAVPRPPFVPEQTVPILEFTEDGSAPLGLRALSFTHPLNSNVSWSVSPNTTFAIERTTGVLVLQPGASLDVYEQPSYAITAFAEDNAGNIASGAVTVNVVEANRPPAFIMGASNVSFSPFSAMAAWTVELQEYSAEGRALGLVLAAGDSNRRDSLTFRLLSTVPAEAASVFSLDAFTGTLRLSNGLSDGGAFVFNESWPVGAGGDPFLLRLNVEVRDNGVPSKAAAGVITVNITQVRPRVRASTYTPPLDAAEGTVLGTPPVGLLSSSASVVGMSAISWSIEGGDAPALLAIGVNNATGELTMQNVSALDYNARRTYSVTAVATYTIPKLLSARPVSVNSTDPEVLAASDAALSTQTIQARAPITIALRHVNRAPAWNSSFARVYAPFRYAGAVGPALYVFSRDLDVFLQDISERLTFTIASGNTADAAFDINATNGQLIVTKPGSPALVYVQGSPAPTVDLVVRVTDAGINGPRMSADMAVTVEVLEGNLPPSLNNTRLTVHENSAVGSTVGSPLVATDPDPGTRLRWNIAWATVDGAFRIDPRSGQIFVNASDLDFESRRLFTLIVQVTDSGRIPLSTTAEVIIGLVDVNEKPHITEAGPFFINENSPVRSLVGAVSATDADAADNAAGAGSGLRYSISSAGQSVLDATSTLSLFTDFSGTYLLNSVRFSDVQAPFGIDADTGMIWVSQGGLNMEARPTYTLTVRATDLGGLVDEIIVTVALNNVNDMPSLGDLKLYAVENSVGTVGGLVVADDDANQRHVYSLGPHADTHYCAAWHAGALVGTSARTSLTTLIRGQYIASTFVPAPVEFRRLAGRPALVDFRMGGPGKGKISVSGYDSELVGGNSIADLQDRYEVEVDGGEGRVTITRFVASPVSVSFRDFNGLTRNRINWRASPVLLANVTHPAFLASPDTVMAEYYVELSGPQYRKLTVGSRSSNDLDAVYTPIAVATDTSSAPLRALSSARGFFLSLDATHPFRRISSVCFAASAFAGNSYNLGVDYATGMVWQADLDYEAQRFLGVEVAVTDVPGGSALSPSYLREYAVIEVVAIDQNEAPSWDASTMVDCANASISRVLACVTIPENSPAGTLIATIPRALDPDVWRWASDDGMQALDYTMRLDNVPDAARVIDFSDAELSRVEWTLVSNDFYGSFEWGLNHSSRDVVVMNPGLLDFESTQGAPQEFRVWATDLNWAPRLSTAAALIVVRISDVNEAPTLKPASGAWTVEENSDGVTLVGTPADLGASDPDTPGTAFATLRYAITGGTGAEIFTINPSTGQIATGAGVSLDFEATRNYTLAISVSDGGVPSLSASTTILVTVVDINEAPVLSVPALVQVLETATDLFGPAFGVSDPDFGAFHTWMVVGGNGSALFTTGCSGRLSVMPGAVLDFEAESTIFDIVVRVSDNGSPPLFDEKTLLVKILDANEAPSIAPDQRFTVLEAATAGFALGTVRWSDPDTSSLSAAWRTPSFSLASEGNLFGYLEIDRTTGVLSVGSRPLVGIVDPANDNDVTLNLIVDITDGGGLRGRTPIAIEVIGINYPPVWSAAPGQMVVLEVDENTPGSPLLAGDFVGEPIPATDRNAKHVPSLSFSIDAVSPAFASGYFAVQTSTSGGMGQAQVSVTALGASSLDFESRADFTVTLRVHDPVNATAAMNVTISVRNRNEAPTLTYANGGSANVAENSPAGTLLAEAVPEVSDPERDTLSYAIVGGSGASLFEINATGRIFVAPGALLDFESIDSYTLVIEGTDSGFPDGSAAALPSRTVIAIFLLDVNEAPFWTFAAPSMAAELPFELQEQPVLTVLENSPAGTAVQVVGAGGASFPLPIYARDVDAGSEPVFSLDGAEWAAAYPSLPVVPFSIDSSSGDITVRDGSVAPNFEARQSYVLGVVVADAGGLRARANLTVSLQNANEPPAWTGVAAWTRVFVRLVPGAIVGQPLQTFATDPDLAVPGNGEKLSFSLGAITATANAVALDATNLASAVAIQPSTGQLSLGSVSGVPALSAAGTIVTISATVILTDAAGLSVEREFAFTTTDNNNPPVCSAASLSVNENAAGGALVGEMVASDPDSGVGQTLSFSLTQSSSSAGQAVPFVVASEANKPVIRVAAGARLDFETAAAAAAAAGLSGGPRFNMVLTVTDSNVNLPLSAQCELVVSLRDINEAPLLQSREDSAASPASFAFSVPENSAAGTVLQLLKAGTRTFARVTATAADSPASAADIRDAVPVEGREMHIASTDEDAGDRATYSLRAGAGRAPPAGLFVIGASTGVISVSASATPAQLSALDFEAAGPGGRDFSLTVVVTDAGGLEASAPVLIALGDENDASTWNATGIRSVTLISAGVGANMTVVARADGTVARLTLDESAAPGTVVGVISALDVDAGAAGTLRYSLVPNAESSIFVVNAVTGVLSLCPTCSADWEDREAWTPTVTVSDTSSAPLIISLVVPVDVLDVADGAVLSVAMASGESSASGVNVEGSDFSSSHSAMSLLTRSDGGSKVVFTGVNLGLTAARIAGLGSAAPFVNITASYGPTSGNEYSGIACRISTPGSALECTTVAASGGNFLWRFVVQVMVPGARPAVFTSGGIRTGVLPPSISGVTLTSDPLGDIPAGVAVLNTTGGGTATRPQTYLRFAGANFGPVGTAPITVRYGPGAGTGVEYTARACVVRRAHSVVVCLPAPGVGRDLHFTITVTNSPRQFSSPFETSSISYMRPVVSSVIAAPLGTVGGDAIAIQGAGFGPRGSAPVTLAYALPAVWALTPVQQALPGIADLIFASPGCSVENDTMVLCTAGAGVGTGLAPRLTVGLQTSADVTAAPRPLLSYRRPTIVGLSGSALDRMPTQGGSTFRLSGADFGPAFSTTPDRLNATATLLGAAFSPFPAVAYGHLFVRPTAPVKPLGVEAVAGQACESIPGPRCTAQCGTTIVSCVNSQWSVQDAPAGSVCFEAQEDGTDAGVIVASFINSTDDRCTPAGPMRYTAANCRVSAPHTGIECVSVEGVGRWHHVRVAGVGLQSSASPFPFVSYAAPVITEFSGDGARSASTAGAQTVVIRGLNFGALQSDILSVTYGANTSEFTAASCALTTAHSEITCTTAPGAGARLAWTVRVGNQDSVTPLTDYAAPTIDSIGGEGAEDCPTAGAAKVVLTGRNFASTQFLDFVTYGPTGTEYAATGCNVTVRDTQIECHTVPGVGRRLFWRVSVRGQASRLSSEFTSYAGPDAIMLSVENGDTSGVAGVVMYGTDFGTAVPFAPVYILMDRYGKAKVRLADIASEWGSYRAALLSGDALAAEGNLTDSIAAWLEAASFIPIQALIELPEGEEGILFDIPDGCGKAREIVVFTDGIPSNPVLFSYNDPIIRNVAPVRDARGQLRVVVEGTGFCGRPTILVVPRPVEDRPNTPVVVLEERPTGQSDLAAEVLPNTTDAALQGGAADRETADLEQQIAAQQSAMVEVGMDMSGSFVRRLQTVGASASSSSSPSSTGGASSMSIVVNGDAIAPSIVTTKRIETIIATPPDLGERSIDISLAGPDGSTPSTSFRDLAPFFESGRAYTVGATPGSGRRLQTVPGAPAGASALVDMRTSGGQRIVMPSVTSLKTTRAEDIVVLIGGRNCTSVVLSDTTGGPAPATLVSTVSCLTPPGIGLNLTMSVCSSATTGGCSPQFDNRGFSYAAPAVTAVALASAPTAASSNVLVAGGQAGVPTSGSSVVISGSGFGSVALLGPEYTVKVTLTLSAGGIARDVNAPVVSQTDSSLVVSLPEGFGASASLLVQTQRTGAGAILGETYVQDAAAVSIAYAAPSVRATISGSRATQGGSDLTILGANFGPAERAPTVAVGGNACPVKSFNHSVITCTLPAGQGSAASVVVTLAGQASPTGAPGARFAYSAPSLSTVSPLRAPTDGFSAPVVAGGLRQPLMMTLTGSNFGSSPVVELTPAPGSAAAAAGVGAMRVPASAMAAASPDHSLLVFPMPEGTGAGLVVRVVAGDQASPQTSFVFSYDAPVITAVTRAGRSADACLPVTEVVARARDLKLVNRTSRPDCFPSAGGFIVSILGTSFGPASAPVSVTIAGTECVVQSHSHNATLCRLGAGMGDKLAVTLLAAGQAAAAASPGRPAALFSYDPPVITNVLPNIPFAIGGERLVITGYNFGQVATPVRILVGDRPCLDGEWVSDGQVTCTAPADVVGPKRLSILIANRTEPFVYEEEEEVVIYQCKAGHYGIKGEECVDCTLEEPGAQCPGGELETDLVTSLPGFYRSNIPIATRARDRESLCHPKRQAREECPAFLACNPAGACLGANACAEGYEGLRCGQCADGFYRLNGGCRECPDRTSALVILFVVVAVASLACMYFMARSGSVWPIAMVAIDYAQVLALMNRFSIKWPAPTVTRWLVAASASFLNLELIAPECSIKDVTFAGKWTAIEVLPFVVAVVLTLAAFAHKLALLALRPNRPSGGSHHFFNATALLAFRMLYVHIARNTLDVFNCAPLSAGNTKTEFLAANLDIPCYQRDGVHLQLVGAGIAGIILYLAVIPAYMGWTLYRNRGRIFLSQLARARGESIPTSEEDLAAANIEPTSPDAAFRRVWTGMYASFKPGSWYWEGVIAARKFTIVFTSLLYNRTTTYQQALCLLVLFAALTIHVRVRPYMSADTAARLLNKYDSKVQYKAAEEARQASAAFTANTEKRRAEREKALAVREAEAAAGVPDRRASFFGAVAAARVSATTRNSAADSEEESDVYALTSAINRIRTRRQVFSLAAVKTRAALLQRRIVMTYPILAVFLDPNVVETVCLVSLILTGLAGVMFGSQLFAGANLERFFAAQYDALAYATVLLLAVTAAYLVVCLALDAVLALDPDRLEDFASSFLSWNASMDEVMSDKRTLFGAQLGSTRALAADAARPKSRAVGAFLPGAKAAVANSRAAAAQAAYPGAFDPSSQHQSDDARLQQQPSAAIPGADASGMVGNPMLGALAAAADDDNDNLPSAAEGGASQPTPARPIRSFSGRGQFSPTAIASRRA